MSRVKKLLQASVLAMAAASCVLLTACEDPFAQQNETTGTSSNASATQTPTPSGTPNKQCTDNFVVKLDPNEGANLFSKGVSPVTEEFRAQVIQGAKEDPRILYNYLVASPLAPKLQAMGITKASDLAPLKNGECYYDKGRGAYGMWLGHWLTAKVTYRPSLPATGVNTGAAPGGEVFQQKGAIPPSWGYDVSYEGAPEFDHFTRGKCGQNGKEHGSFGLPDKPHGNGTPDVVTTTTTRPPTTSPPVTTTNTPPPCPPGTTPPDCTVPKVPTQQPGSGGDGDGGFGQYGGHGDDPPRTADPAPAPPAASPPPPAYTPPAAPAPEPAPAPPPVQTTRDPNPPTVAPSTQPPNHGTVPTTGCANPDFC